jgi:hypothetical protein
MRLDRGHTAAEILGGGMAMVVENTPPKVDAV